MSTSPYFNHLEVPGEHRLYDSLVQESIKITGFDVVYIQRTDFEIDPVLYEPKASVFADGWTIEANISDHLTGWEGEGTIMNQFGLNVLNSGHIQFSKTRWEEIMKKRRQAGKPTLDRPLEGDLIYFGYGHDKFNNTLFVINQVDFSDSAWQMGRNFVYRCRCSLFTPSTNDRVQLEAFGLPAQYTEALDKEEVKQQNSNIGNVKSPLEVFNEQHPFGGI